MAMIYLSIDIYAAEWGALPFVIKTIQSNQSWTNMCAALSQAHLQNIRIWNVFLHNRHVLELPPLPQHYAVLYHYTHPILSPMPCEQ